MTSNEVSAMPSWILYAVPASAGTSMACLLAFGSNPVVGQFAGIVGLFSLAASLVVVPVSIYALVANPKLRTAPRVIGTTACSLPIIGMLASFFGGGI